MWANKHKHCIDCKGTDRKHYREGRCAKCDYHYRKALDANPNRKTCHYESVQRFLKDYTPDYSFKRYPKEILEKARHLVETMTSKKICMASCCRLPVQSGDYCPLHLYDSKLGRDIVRKDAYFGDSPIAE